MPFNEWPWVLPIVLLLTIPPMRSCTLNPVHFSDCSAGEGKVGLFTELPLKRLNPSQPSFGIFISTIRTNWTVSGGTTFTSSPPPIVRTVLIVKVKNLQHWPSGIATHQQQLNRQTNSTFTGTAFGKVCWIGVIESKRTMGKTRGHPLNGTTSLTTKHHLMIFKSLAVLLLLYKLTKSSHST